MEDNNKIKEWIKEHKGELIIAGAGAASLVALCYGIKNYEAIGNALTALGKLAEKKHDVIREIPAVVHKEECYGGVPLSKLNKIADECRSGGWVTIVGDELYYHFKSGRGHQTNHSGFVINSLGKISEMTVGGYPGQINFPNYEFERLCNEQFDFIQNVS